MTITVEKNFDLRSKAAALKVAMAEQLGREVLQGRTFIIARTKEGTDVNGSPFAPYAPLTKLIRAGREKITDHVNLEDTGKMFKAILTRMRIMPNGLEGEIYVSGGGAVKSSKNAKPVTAAERAIYHQTGGGKLPQRKWFGLGAQRVAEIMDRLNALIQRML
jgi:hypothetical protein